MKIGFGWLLATIGCMMPLFFESCKAKIITSVTVPVVLDHNRMLLDAEIQRKDGSWRKARLIIDTGNPVFSISEELARDLGMELSGVKKTSQGYFLPLEVRTPEKISIGGKLLNFNGIKTKAYFGPIKAFFTTHCDANLPSTLLMRYHVVFDYPGLKLTIAEPGSLQPRGICVPTTIDDESGILQIDAVIDTDSLSFALDNGASYSCISEDVLKSISQMHSDWLSINGAIGCANMWGHWPLENRWLIMRIPEIKLGAVILTDVGITGLPNFYSNGTDLGTWYSKKTARPVVGFLGPNALKSFRVEVDYANSKVYFEKDLDFNPHDMDLVGLTLNTEPDGNFIIIGVTKKNGKPTVEGVEPGDVLLRVDDLRTTGATFGTVVDALRGKPGDVRILELERNGKRFKVETKVTRVL